MYFVNKTNRAALNCTLLSESNDCFCFLTQRNLLKSKCYPTWNYLSTIATWKLYKQKKHTLHNLYVHSSLRPRENKILLNKYVF